MKWITGLKRVNPPHFFLRTYEAYLSAEVMAGLTPGVLDAAAVEFFTCGRCAALALALHRITGWPLVRLSQIVDDDWFHIVVNSPIGYLDITGPVSFREWRGAHWPQVDDPRQRLLPTFLGGTWKACPIEADDLNLDYAEDNLELVMPFAKAVLERYFPSLILTPTGGPGREAHGAI
jgi:hypothetical protein